MKKVLFDSKHLKITYEKDSLINLICLVMLFINIIRNNLLNSEVFMFLVILNEIRQFQKKSSLK